MNEESPTSGTTMFLRVEIPAGTTEVEVLAAMDDVPAEIWVESDTAAPTLSTNSLNAVMTDPNVRRLNVSREQAMAVLMASRQGTS